MANMIFMREENQGTLGRKHSEQSTLPTKLKTYCPGIGSEIEASYWSCPVLSSRLISMVLSSTTQWKKVIYWQGEKHYLLWPCACHDLELNSCCSMKKRFNHTEKTLKNNLNIIFWQRPILEPVKLRVNIREFKQGRRNGNDNAIKHFIG